MTREIYEECRLASIRKEIDRIELALQELRGKAKQAPQEKPWPQKGDTYWVVYSDGDTGNHVFRCDNIDMRSKDFGSIYKTKEQAEQISQNRKVHTMLKELADFEPDWLSDKQCKYHICWSYPRDSVGADVVVTWGVPNNVYFRTEEEARKAIQAVKDKFGDDAIELYCKHGVI